MLSEDWKKIKADMAAGIAIPGHELDRVIQENCDLEELGIDCPVHGPDGARIERRGVLGKYSQDEVLAILKAHGRM